MIEINVYRAAGDWYGARWIDGEYDGCDALDVPGDASPETAIEHARRMPLSASGARQVRRVEDHEVRAAARQTIELVLDAARLCQAVYDSSEIRDLERAYYTPSRWWPADDQASAVDAARAAFARAGRERDYDRAAAGETVAVRVMTDDCAYVAYVRVPEGASPESLGLAYHPDRGWVCSTAQLEIIEGAG